MRKFLSLVLALMLVFSMAAMPAVAEGENVFTISMGTKPNLDIHWNAGSTGAQLLGVMREGLYSYTETGFQLAGAESVEVSEDGLTWTFKLRQDAKWSDGKPVVAGDYVYSMQRLVNPEVASTYMNDYGRFLKNGPAISAGEMAVDQLGVVAKDDYTLEIQLEQVCAFFDALLCYTTYFPLRADTITSETGNGDWAWNVETSITNGAMKMTACDEEQEIVLEKNPEYWNAANVKTDKIVVKLADDTNTALGMVTTGDVDMIFDFPSEEATSLQEKGLYHATPRLHTGFLLVNTQKEPYSDPRVRKALLLSVDRDYLANTLFNGTRMPAVSYVGHGFPGSTSEADFRTEAGDLFASDVEQAKALLTEAGFEGGANFPVLEISYANNPNNMLICEYLQACWEALGITVQLTSVEPAAMTELRDAGNFDITPQNWGADYFDASNMLSIFVSGNFINAGRYSSEKFDQLYNDSMVKIDNVERIHMLQEAEKVLVQEDAGMIPLFHASTYAIYADAVCGNVIMDANGQVMLTQVVVTK